MVEHTVLPGEVFFCTESSVLRTVLGSCIALTVWHPGFRVGGMCHYVLPNSSQPNAKVYANRYGEFALDSLLREMQSICNANDYVLRLYGGAAMFGNRLEDSIGAKNIEFALEWLDRHALKPAYQDIGGRCSRTVKLDLGSGEIDLKRYISDDQMGVQSLEGMRK